MSNLENQARHPFISAESVPFLKKEGAEWTNRGLSGWRLDDASVSRTLDGGGNIFNWMPELAGALTASETKKR